MIMMMCINNQYVLRLCMKCFPYFVEKEEKMSWCGKHPMVYTIYQKKPWSTHLFCIFIRINVEQVTTINIHTHIQYGVFVVGLY